MKKIKKKELSKTYNLRFLLISLTIVGVATLLVSVISRPVDINQIAESTQTPIEGTLLKTAPGQIGSYIIVNLSGNMITVNTNENLDSLEGNLVRVSGSISISEDKSHSQLISPTKIELLSQQ